MSTDDGFNREQVDAVRPLLEEYRRLWPLSLKQVYYLAVEAGEVGTAPDESAAFVYAIRRGLMAGLLPVGAFSWDLRGRDGGAWENADDFLLSEVESFLWGVSTQPVAGPGEIRRGMGAEARRAGLHREHVGRVLRVGLLLRTPADGEVHARPGRASG